MSQDETNTAKPQLTPDDGVDVKGFVDGFQARRWEKVNHTPTGQSVQAHIDRTRLTREPIDVEGFFNDCLRRCTRRRSTPQEQLAQKIVKADYHGFSIIAAMTNYREIHNSLVQSDVLIKVVHGYSSSVSEKNEEFDANLHTIRNAFLRLCAVNQQKISVEYVWDGWTLVRALEPLSETDVSSF